MRFSPSSLSVFRDCPSCFWNEQKLKIKRPRGIFPSLPGGMDRVLKTYVDSYVAAGKLPKEVAAIKGAKPFANRHLMESWRNWRTAPMVNIEVPECEEVSTLSGAMDDLLQFTDGSHSPIDFKTRGAPPKDGASEGYYGPQMDAYRLTLEVGAQLKMNDRAYLSYWWPKEVREDGVVVFNTETVILKTDPGRARQLVIEATKCLAEDNQPDPAPQCEYCSFLRSRTAAVVA